LSTLTVARFAGPPTDTSMCNLHDNILRWRLARRSSCPAGSVSTAMCTHLHLSPNAPPPASGFATTSRRAYQHHASSTTSCARATMKLCYTKNLRSARSRSSASFPAPKISFNWDSCRSLLPLHICCSARFTLLGTRPQVKEDLVVLLARDVDISHEEYDWDLTKWAPLVQEKEMISWLVKKPSDAEALRARPLTVASLNRRVLFLRTFCWGGGRIVSCMPG
jgi:hypothetical protein